MKRKLSPRRQIEALVGEFEPQVKLAFLDAIRDITSRAELGRIAEALQRGDIAGAIEAVHLDPAAFRLLDSAIAKAFDAGGAATIDALPKLRNATGGQFVVRWDARNIRAETWLRQHSSELVTRIVDDQRAAIREVLVKGMEAGRNPRSVALDIIGRVNKATGRRAGGIVGLTSQQERFVSSAYEELVSGSPDLMAHYLTRVRRDRHFDAMVTKAMAEQRAVPQDMLDRIIGRYKDRLLQLRGETIARTETMAALNQSQMEGMQQAIDSGAVKAETVTKTWHTARDKRVRDSHAAQDREQVGLRDVFSNGLQFPCDPNGPPEETANCRCWMETRIDFTASLIEAELAAAGLA